jgi:hypothetical protein
LRAIVIVWFSSDFAYAAEPAVDGGADADLRHGADEVIGWWIHVHGVAPVLFGKMRRWLMKLQHIA